MLSIPNMCKQHIFGKIIEYPFDDKEQAMFDASVEATKGLLEDVKKFL